MHALIPERMGASQLRVECRSATKGWTHAKPGNPSAKRKTTSPSIWSSLSVLAVAMAAGGILARLEAGPRFDWLLLMTAMGLTAAVLMRLLADNSAEREAQQSMPAIP